jgi:hypothetical protein
MNSRKGYLTMVLDAKTALTQLLQTREQSRPRWTALLGDGTGTITDPDAPDHVFVRVHGLQSSVASVFNKTVPGNRPNLPVLIGTTTEMPDRVQVVGVDWSALPDWAGEALLPLHGADHEVPGPDPVFVQKRAIVPLRASPQVPADMTLDVAADFYPWDDGFNYFEGATTEDLTARIPGAFQARFVTIYVDGESNSLAYLNGEAQVMTFPLDVDRIPRPPEGTVPVCAVRLYSGMTAITEEDIYDFRIIVSPMGGSLAPKAHPLSPVDDNRHTGLLDDSYLRSGVACTGAM